MAAPTTPLYPAGGKHLSTYDLLARFLDENHHLNGLSRYSDLHLKVGHPITYRYDGELVPVIDGAPLTQSMCEAIVTPLLEAKHLEALHASPPRDVDTSWEWTEHKINFRLNVFHDRDGLGAVIRVLPTNVPDAATVGFPSPRTWQDICNLSQGLVIFTGQTGSGKSTCIASILNKINQTRSERIITLEDPVEYIFKSNKALFSQRELGRHVDTFAHGLRSALREDPDIIYVGEMRDRETISLALTAAETGHLVLSTLHTRDTRSSITRIIDMFPAERTKEVATQLSLSLHSIISCKLVPRVGGGRVIAMEVLRNTLPMANLIRTGGIHQMLSLIETGTKDGMSTLDHHLAALVETGVITPADAALAANGKH